MWHEWHEWNKCDTRQTQVQPECYTNDTSATGVKHFVFDNDTSENIFSHPYIIYIENERIQGEEQLYSKIYSSEMPCSYVKMHLKSALQILNVVIAKAISKNCTLDCNGQCSCTFPHS